MFFNDYFFFFNCVFCGDRVIDDEDVSVVTSEDWVSPYECLLRKKARFVSLARAREKERK